MSGSKRRWWKDAFHIVGGFRLQNDQISTGVMRERVSERHHANFARKLDLTITFLCNLI